MDKKTALHFIDQWANFYLRILGEADHLQLLEKEEYTILQPKDGKWASILDVRLEHLDDNDLTTIVNEIKQMDRHVWWNQYSDRVNSVVFPEGRREPAPDDEEVFAVMISDEMPAYRDANINILAKEDMREIKKYLSQEKRHRGAVPPEVFY